MTREYTSGSADDEALPPPADVEVQDDGDDSHLEPEGDK